MDIIGYSRRTRTSPRSRRRARHSVAIKLKTVDSQFIAANLNAQFVVPQHIWSKVAEPATFTNPNPVGSGPFAKVGRFTTQDYVFDKNPNYWLDGRAEDPVPRVHPGRVERLGAARDPERPGRLDAQLRAERRAGVHGEGSEALPRLLRDDGVSDLARLRHDAVPVQPRRVPQGDQPGDQPQRRVEARRVRLRAADRAIGLERHLPEWVRPGDRRPRPSSWPRTTRRRRRRLLTDAGFTYKGSNADRPEGQPGQPRHPRDLGLVGLGRVDADHHQEPAGDRHRLERRSSSRTGTPGTERSATKTRACCGRTPRRARRTGTSTRTCRSEVHARPARTRRTRATGRTSTTPRRRRSSTSGSPRSTRRSSRSARGAGCETCSSRRSRSCRCSSGRAGRRTARSTSTASRRRRTTTATEKIGPGDYNRSTARIADGQAHVETGVTG